MHLILIQNMKMMKKKTQLFPFKQKYNISDDASNPDSKLDYDVKLITQLFLLNKNILIQLMNLILIQKLTMIEKKTYIFPFKQKHNN